MHTLGIIGGIAPESTIAYYRAIVKSYRERRPDGSYPPFVINSIDLTRMLGYVERAEFDRLVDYLVSEIEKLSRAGAQFGILASNTPHIAFNEISRKSPIPLISIVEAAAGEAKGLGLKKLALFGTRFTMQGNFYPDVFSPAGIEIVRPAADELTYIHEKYMGELAQAVFLPGTHDRLLQIVETMKLRDEIDGVILGGTELPLLLTEPTVSGIPLLDTMKIHVKKVVETMLNS